MEANWLLHFTDYRRFLYGKFAFLCRASPVCPLNPSLCPFPTCSAPREAVLCVHINGSIPLLSWFPMGLRSCGQSLRKVGGRKEMTLPHTLLAGYCSWCLFLFYFFNLQDSIYLSVEGSPRLTFFFLLFILEGTCDPVLLLGM